VFDDIVQVRTLGKIRHNLGFYLGRSAVTGTDGSTTAMSDKFVIEDTIEEITTHDGGRTKIGEIGGGDGQP
jgi:hypothetical protein